MEHTTEDAWALMRAAQQIHAERYGAHTFVPGTRNLPVKGDECRRRGRIAVEAKCPPALVAEAGIYSLNSSSI